MRAKITYIDAGPHDREFLLQYLLDIAGCAVEVEDSDDLAETLGAYATLLSGHRCRICSTGDCVRYHADLCSGVLPREVKRCLCMIADLIVEVVEDLSVEENLNVDREYYLRLDALVHATLVDKRRETLRVSASEDNVIELSFAATADAEIRASSSSVFVEPADEDLVPRFVGPTRRRNGFGKALPTLAAAAAAFLVVVSGRIGVADEALRVSDVFEQHTDVRPSTLVPYQDALHFAPSEESTRPEDADVPAGAAGAKVRRKSKTTGDHVESRDQSGNALCVIEPRLGITGHCGSELAVHPDQRVLPMSKHSKAGEYVIVNSLGVILATLSTPLDFGHLTNEESEVTQRLAEALIHQLSSDFMSKEFELIDIEAQLALVERPDEMRLHMSRLVQRRNETRLHMSRLLEQMSYLQQVLDELELRSQASSHQLAGVE